MTIFWYTHCFYTPKISRLLNWISQFISKYIKIYDDKHTESRVSRVSHVLLPPCVTSVKVGPTVAETDYSQMLALPRCYGYLRCNGLHAKLLGSEFTKIIIYNLIHASASSFNSLLQGQPALGKMTHGNFLASVSRKLLHSVAKTKMQEKRRRGSCWPDHETVLHPKDFCPLEDTYI